MSTTATTVRPRITTSYLGVRTLERRAARAALEAEAARYEAERTRASRKVESRLDAEIARFRQIEAKFAPAAPPLHRLADAEGRYYQHADLAVLKKFIAGRNRTIASPSYKSIQAAYEEGRRRGARYDPSFGWD